MDPLTILLLIGVIIIIGLIGEVLFRITGVPDVILLLLFGLGIQFFVGGGQQISAFAPIVAPLALMVLLFDGGLRMRLYKVLHESPRATLLAGLGVLLCVLVSSAAMHLVFGWGFLEGAILGAILGGSSSVIVIGLVKDLAAGNKENVSDLLSLESVVTDVLCIVVTISLIQTLVYGGNDVLAPGRIILSAFSIGLLIGLIAGIAWLRMLHMFRPLPYQHIVTLAIVFIIYAISESFGGSGAIAALFFGLALGNSADIAKMLKLRQLKLNGGMLKRFQSEIAFFVRSFFFVYLGIIVSIGDPYLILIGAVLTALFFLARHVAVILSTLGSGVAEYQWLLTAVAPRGLAAAVLAQFPVSYGMENASMYVGLTFVVLIATILVSTLGVFLFRREQSRCGRARRTALQA